MPGNNVPPVELILTNAQTLHAKRVVLALKAHLILKFHMVNLYVNAQSERKGMLVR